MNDVDHTDVGAYALGLLERPDRDAFARHLADCTTCQRELDELAGLRELLVDVDPVAVDEVAIDESARPVPADLTSRLADRRESRELPRSWIPRVLVAAVILAVVAIGGWAVWAAGPGGDGDHAPAGELLLTGDRFSATDNSSGAYGLIGVEEKGWGTHIALELRGVRGPLACHLVAISREGEEETAVSWGVPEPGYGIPGAPDPLVIHGGTSITRADLARVEVRTVDGDVLLAVSV